MRNLYRILFAIAVIAVVSASCSDEDVTTLGEGKVKLSLSIDDDVTIQSRGISEEETSVLQESCKIYVYSSKGLIRKYHGMNEVPSELWLVS